MKLPVMDQLLQLGYAKKNGLVFTQKISTWSWYKELSQYSTVIQYSTDINCRQYSNRYYAYHYQSLAGL